MKIKIKSDITIEKKDKVAREINFGVDGHPCLLQSIRNKEEKKK